MHGKDSTNVPDIYFPCFFPFNERSEFKEQDVGGPVAEEIQDSHGILTFTGLFCFVYLRLL